MPALSRTWQPEERCPAGHDLAELEWVSSQYEVPAGDVRRVMQFDASGKLYFRGMTQNNPQGVFLQFDLPEYQPPDTCTNAGAEWNSLSGPRDYELSGEACASADAGISRNYVNCSAPQQRRRHDEGKVETLIIPPSF